MRAGKYLALVTIFNLTLAAGSNLGSWPLHHRYQTPSLKEMAAAGQVAPSDLLWKAGMEKWVPCSSVKGLFPVAGPPSLVEVQRDAMPYPATRLPLATPDWNPSATPNDDENISLHVNPSRRRTNYAEFLSRVGAALLDGIFMAVIGFVAAIPVMIFTIVAFGEDDGAVIGSGLGQLISLMIQAVYSIGLDSSVQQGTWGKQIMGIEVTDGAGNRLTVGRATARFFAKWLSGCTCGIGFLMPLFTAKKQALHAAFL